MESQQDTARRELFEHIDLFQKSTLSNYKKAFSDFYEKINEAVYSWISDQDKIIAEKFNKAKTDLEKPVSEKEAMLKQTQNDMIELNRWKQNLE